MVVKPHMSTAFSRSINYFQRLFGARVGGKKQSGTNRSVARIFLMKMIGIIADDSQIQAAFLHPFLIG